MPKLTKTDQLCLTARLKAIEKYHGIGIILSCCMYCGEIYDVKLADISGLSHGVCDDARCREELKNDMEVLR
jgi:hypothetical protein